VLQQYCIQLEEKNRFMNKKIRDYILTTLATFIMLIWILPLIWSVFVSLKSEIEVLAYPPNIFFEPTLNNFKDAISGSLSIVSELGDSFLIATITTIFTLLLSIPAAYALARLNLFGKKKLGFYVLATQMIPPMGLVIPYYLILGKFGWLDTYHGMIIVYMTFSLPFAIWLMVSFMEDIPREMEEAAFLDKASRMKTLLFIILPQVKGGIAVTTIFTFMNAWNEFLFAVQLSGNKVRPVTIAMYNFVSVEQTLWAKLCAAALIAMIPVIIIGIIGNNHIIKGLTLGAVKGGGRK
jgi:ABC-type glycerol-3-phosphate transport system permease component|tara:strand:+ start:518 stop:1399 length:882 start_codon:yes stop_codon:yes gene_type:complete